MKRKKSFLGLTVWLLFTILVTGAFWQIAYAWLAVRPKVTFEKEEIILGCVLLVTAVGLMLTRMVALKVQKKFVITGKKKVVLNIVAVLLLITTALVSRFYYIETIDVKQAENLYYEFASVGTDKLVLHTTNHVAIIYAYLLSFLLTVFGNKISVCIYFQILLQCCTLLFGYFSIRNISGKIAAMTAAMILAVYPSYISSMLPLSPENLLICIFVFGFWMISLLWKHMNVGKTSDLYDGLLFFMAGLSTAALIYTDIIGIVLLIMAVGGIFICYKNAEHSILKSLLLIFYYVLGSIVGAIALFEIEAVICKESFMRIIEHYLIPWMNVSLSHISIYPSVSLEVSSVIILISALWCVRYWQAEQDENVMYLLMLLCVSFIRLFFQTSVDYQMLLLFAWIFIASVSLKSFCSKYKSQSDGEKNLIVSPDMKRNDMQIEEKTDMDVSKKILDGPPDKPNLIPNPLPLPKKHIKKEMDYAFVPDENRMHYDIQDIAENDDFEIL